MKKHSYILQWISKELLTGQNSYSIKKNMDDERGVVIMLVSIAFSQFVLPSYLLFFLIILVSYIYWLNHTTIYKPLQNTYEDIQKSPVVSHKKGKQTFQKIDTYIITNKKYLSQDINLQSLAIQFEISKGYLSQLINSHTNTNFNDYINTLRIETSKKMLLDTRYNNYTIESIGLECGFKSKSNFYTTFKKFTGYTPNQFKKISSESSTS